MKTTYTKNWSRIFLPCLPAAITLLSSGAHAAMPPAQDPNFTPPIAAKRSVTATTPAPARANPAFAGMICQSETEGGKVAFDSAVALSRPGARAVAVTGRRTLYQVTTPDTLRKLHILNPGRCPWEVIGRDGIIREGVAEGAFVSFDPITGRVVSVAIYQKDRTTQEAPRLERVGNNLTLRGRFLVVADAHQGRAILQRGASEVRLNVQTGGVIATK